MALDNQSLIFNLDKTFNFFNLNAKQYDTHNSRGFTFYLVQNAKPFNLAGISVSIGGKKPDGKDIFNNAIILDADKGLIQIDLTTQMLVKEGILKLELILIKDSIRLSSYPFEINVIPSVTNFSTIQSSDEFGALTEALTKVEGTLTFVENKVNNAVNDLKSNSIGGTNLLTGTQMFTDDWKQGSGTSCKIDNLNLFEGCAVQLQWYNWNYFMQKVTYELGKTYTISCYAKTDCTENVSIYFTVADDKTAWGQKTLTSEWKKYYLTFTADQPTGDLRIESFCNNWGDGKIYISKVKLEHGEIATDWCDSPFDTNCKLDDFGGTNLFDGTDFSTPLKLYESTASVFFQQGISVQEQTSIYNPNKKIIGISSQSSTFGDTYCTILKTNNRIIQPNTTYTISFWYLSRHEGDNLVSSSFIYFNKNDDCSQGNFALLALDDLNLNNGGLEWIKYTKTFTTPNEIKNIQLRLGFRCTAYAWMVVDGIKLERGRVATDWCLSANETAKKVELDNLGVMNYIKNTDFIGAIGSSKVVPQWATYGDFLVFNEQGDSNHNKSATIYMCSWSGNYASKSVGGIYSDTIYKIDENTPYTLSCNVFLESNVKGCCIRVEFYNSSMQLIHTENCLDANAIGSHDVNCTFTTPTGYVTSRVVLEDKGVNGDNINSQYVMSVSKLMLNKGYLNAEYSPAIINPVYQKDDNLTIYKDSNGYLVINGYIGVDSSQRGWMTINLPFDVGTNTYKVQLTLAESSDIVDDRSIKLKKSSQTSHSFKVCHTWGAGFYYTLTV